MAIILREKKYFYSKARPTLIAGPCMMESEELVEEVAKFLSFISQKYEIDVIFKNSYDKANRSFVDSPRGPGIERGLAILEKIKKKYDFPLLVDIHLPQEAKIAAQVVDMLQIPAFLCRQTDLLVAAGRTGKVVNIKKGQFLSPYEIGGAVGKVRSTGNEQITITERGFSFGYQNLVVDMRSLVIMQSTGCPIVFDGTHSVQYPGAGKGKTAGDRRFVRPLVRAAVAVGIEGIFLEVHPEPEKALSDAANQLPFSEVEKIVEEILQISHVHAT